MPIFVLISLKADILIKKKGGKQNIIYFYNF